ncbi:serine/threonine protein kinase [Halioxenophilus sp. WMMB6]|uniref:serine/threonine protein kinase n=1 Tax=Halioxenophilus sp. WMMB6 TaxID=3073815 RepID=UPI00295EE066|nr:serine/threonine protein kinase [Halioxenophilus sp. WMMB6]
MSDDQHPYARLTPDTVLDAVESLGFYSDARILPLNSYENRVYQVGLEGGTPIIAKFYRPERWSREQILEEHHFALELAALEIPMVAPLQDADGKTLHQYQDFLFAIYPRKGGHAPELDNFDHLLVIGRLLGRLHNCGREQNFTQRPSFNLYDFAQEPQRFLLDNGFIPPGLTEAYQTLTDDLIRETERIWQGVDCQAIRLHGDCHPGNILWRDESAFFVDLDDARMGPAIQDLWMLLSGERQQRVAQLSEVLEGYQQFANFNFAEINLIETLRTWRIMHYAAWLARRWQDPAFPHNFPWFNTERYWAEHILELREQLAALQEPPLALF